MPEVNTYRITVDVPLPAAHGFVDHIFDAVAVAAHEAEPTDRDEWDVIVYGTAVYDDVYDVGEGEHV